MSDGDLHRRGAKATAVALHESGHILAGWAARPAVQILHASVAPPGVRTRWRTDVSSDELAATLEKLILIDLAGGAAERVAGYWPDCNAISTDEHNATGRALTIVARRYLERGGTIGGGITGEMVAEAEQLVERLRPQAEEFAAANFQAIERIAAALDQRKTIDVDMIAKLIGDGEDR
jgi:hypothetical protein